MKAKNLHHFGSSPAPEEWEEIQEISDAKPRHNTELSLQKLNGLNICLWMKRDYVYWEPASDFFHVKSDDVEASVLS